MLIKVRKEYCRRLKSKKVSFSNCAGWQKNDISSTQKWYLLIMLQRAKGPLSAKVFQKGLRTFAKPFQIDWISNPRNWGKVHSKFDLIFLLIH